MRETACLEAAAALLGVDLDLTTCAEPTGQQRDRIRIYSINLWIGATVLTCGS